jgi:hypothetical protein
VPREIVEQAPFGGGGNLAEGRPDARTDGALRVGYRPAWRQGAGGAQGTVDVGEGDLVGGAGEEITTVAPLLRTHQTRPDESHDDAA